jgi:AhpD family alkylhydroperoxidase
MNVSMQFTNDLMQNIDKIHTTQLGVERIKRNLDLKTDDVVDWCKQKIVHADEILRKGKNWYVYAENSVITVNAHSYTIITAHQNKFKNQPMNNKMNNPDKDKIEDIIKNRKIAHKFYSEKSEVYRKFCEMEQCTYKNGNLSRLQKELIAIGISVVMNCESCMEWHIKQAVDIGASEAEIIEAIEVAIEFSGGPATVSARFAMNIIDYYLK